MSFDVFGDVAWNGQPFGRGWVHSWIDGGWRCEFLRHPDRERVPLPVGRGAINVRYDIGRFEAGPGNVIDGELRNCGPPRMWMEE